MEAARPPDSPTHAERLAIGLAVFSVALGLAEYFAPRRIARLAGVRRPDARSDEVMRSLGTREVSHGLAILGQPAHPAGLWARAGGDLVDLYTLRKAGRSYELNRAAAATAAAVLLGSAAIDVYVARRLQHAQGV
jgi:hypothetical protein